VGKSDCHEQPRNQKTFGLASSVSEEINSFASLEEFVLLKIYDATKAEECNSTWTWQSAHSWPRMAGRLLTTHG
jgi:hypothetical protein